MYPQKPVVVTGVSTSQALLFKLEMVLHVIEYGALTKARGNVTENDPPPPVVADPH